MTVSINAHTVETRRSIECKPDGAVIISEVRVETSISIEQRQRNPYADLLNSLLGAGRPAPLSIPVHDELAFDTAPRPGAPSFLDLIAERAEPVSRTPSGQSTIASGCYKTPSGYLDGFHVYNNNGQWVGVYPTYTRADAERRSL